MVPYKKTWVKVKFKHYRHLKQAGEFAMLKNNEEEKNLVQPLQDCVALLKQRLYIAYSKYDVPNWTSCVSVASCCASLQFVRWLWLSFISLH